MLFYLLHVGFECADCLSTDPYAKGISVPGIILSVRVF